MIAVIRYDKIRAVTAAQLLQQLKFRILYVRTRGIKIKAFVAAVPARRYCKIAEFILQHICSIICVFKYQIGDLLAITPISATK